MESSVIDMAVGALGIILEPSRFLFLVIGVFIGLFIGVVPGLGGVIALSLLLPFTFAMDTYSAFAMMMGLLAVSVTSDTIPAVLFGVPGTVGSAATVLDGHPMARKGEAGRAFGAAFMASMLGGLFGALVLGVSAPVLRPFMLNIGSPELLAICVFGLSLVAILSGSSPAKGIAAVAIGMLLSTVGDDPNTSTLRMTFDTIYLWDGFPLVPLALGLFALPELADLVVMRRPVEGDRITNRKGQFAGAKDVFRNWFLMLRCSTIGAALGAVPGIGAGVIDWIAYGHAAQTEKGAAQSFGKGDVRGVIASESSNNAKEGGTLIPTLAFGVPGSASMALLLGAFLVHGLIPGPKMLTERLDVTYTLVWSLAIANILGAGICFMFAGQLARLASVRIGILAPLILSVTFIGAFQGSEAYGDLWALLSFGLLGWVMKRLRWSRPPLLLGFVLGSLLERYLSISFTRYGWDWITNPVVVIFFLLTAYGLLMPAVRRINAWRNRPASAVSDSFNWRVVGWDGVFVMALLAAFGAALVMSVQWPPVARMMPQIASLAGIAMLLLVLGNKFLKTTSPASADQGSHLDVTTDFSGLSSRQVRNRSLGYFGWLIALLAGCYGIGMLPATIIFIFAFLRFEGKETWKLSLLITLCAAVIYYLVFHLVLRISWPDSMLGSTLSWASSYRLLDLI